MVNIREVNTGRITVRKYQAADNATAAGLFENGMLDYITPDVSRQIAAAIQAYATEEKLRFFSNVSGNLHEKNGGCMFVAVNETDEAVGTAAVAVSNTNLANSSAELYRMSVRKTERRKGIGKTLLEHAVAYVKAMNVREIQLDIWEFQRMAEHFYLANGFVVDPDYREPWKGCEPGTADVLRLRRVL